jgi:hypothetical protein
MRASEVPANKVSTYRGVMVLLDLTTLAVNVNGNILPVQYADPLVLAEGDPVLVEISSGATGQGEAFVRCRLTDAPRPGEGIVKTVPPSSPTITVTGSDTIDYTAKFVDSYAPVVNDPVIMSWNAAVPTVVGKVTTTSAPPPPAAPPNAPPPPSSSGTGKYAATDSDTYWSPGGWGSWAGGGSNVYQGSYGSGQVYGAWFYSGSPAELAGRDIFAIRFTLGSRRPVGSNNSPITLHLYAHSNQSKPGGDVTRTVGPYDVVILPGAGQQTFGLPLSFAPALTGGGGIAIAGDPYAGFTGIKTEPMSGFLELDWRR